MVATVQGKKEVFRVLCFKHNPTSSRVYVIDVCVTILFSPPSRVPKCPPGAEASGESESSEIVSSLRGSQKGERGVPSAHLKLRLKFASETWYQGPSSQG